MHEKEYIQIYSFIRTYLHKYLGYGLIYYVVVIDHKKLMLRSSPYSPKTSSGKL